MEVQSSSGSDSDIASNLWEDDRDDDRSSLTSIDSKSGIVIHNTTSLWLSLRLPSHSNYPLQDEGDDFDIIANYVFQVSCQREYGKHQHVSDSPSLEFRRRVSTYPSSGYRTISQGRSRSNVKRRALNFIQSGGDPDIATLSLEKQLPITVDESGGLFYCQQVDSGLTIWLVGAIGDQTDPTGEILQLGPMSDEPTPRLPVYPNRAFGHRGGDTDHRWLRCTVCWNVTALCSANGFT